jgi:hypothetical protein
MVVCDSTVPWGQGEGVYIQATAYELDTADEIRAARRIKKGPDSDDSPEEFMGERSKTRIQGGTRKGLDE